MRWWWGPLSVVLGGLEPVPGGWTDSLQHHTHASQVLLCAPNPTGVSASQPGRCCHMPLPTSVQRCFALEMPLTVLYR